MKYLQTNFQWNLNKNHVKKLCFHENAFENDVCKMWAILFWLQCVLTHWGRDKMALFKWIFLNENLWISIEISLKFVPRGPINYIPALVQKMAWHWPGDKPLSEPMMVNLLTHIYVTRPQWVNDWSSLRRIQGQIQPVYTIPSPSSWYHQAIINTLRTWQNGHHFADVYSIYKCISLNWNAWIFIWNFTKMFYQRSNCQ